MFSEDYAYLTFVLLFFVPWCVIYASRRDLHREMFVVGVFMGVIGILTEYFFWTVDWWKPVTFTHTLVGFEDFMLGFFNGGIAASIYEFVRRKSLYRKKTDTELNNSHFLNVILLTAYLLSFVSWGLGYTSFVACVVASLMGALLMIYYRHDLLISALVSGILLVFLSIPVYWITTFFHPSWYYDVWMFGNLYEIYFVSIPAEDLIFYFFTGFWVGPLYELYTGSRLRKMSRS